jgi:hypothetical protein
LGLVAAGLAIWAGIVLLVPFLIALPLLLYDVLFRAPAAGRKEGGELGQLLRRIVARHFSVLRAASLS